MNIHGFEAIIVCGRYFLIRLIGHGSFGLVYHGRDIITNEMVAVKLENITTRHPQLENEYNVHIDLIKQLIIVQFNLFFTYKSFRCIIIISKMSPMDFHVFYILEEMLSII